MRAVQVKLQHENEILMCWLVTEKTIKPRMKITLKDYPGKWYIVDEVYTISDTSHLHTDWKVGGLD